LAKAAALISGADLIEGAAACDPIRAQSAPVLKIQNF
jgi:hypothetical protein